MSEKHNSIYVPARDKLINWVRQQLTGEFLANREEKDAVIHDHPTEVFPCGALYPVDRGGVGIDPASKTNDIDVVKTDDASEDGSEDKSISRYSPPSSLGFSFYITGKDIQFQLLYHAVVYKQDSGDERRKIYSREVLKEDNGVNAIDVTCPQKYENQHYSVLKGKAKINVLWRPHGNGWLITVSLSNTEDIKAVKDGRDFLKLRSENTLFEAGLDCVIDSGVVGDYPRASLSLLTEEEQELELQYSHHQIYAVGHGCAVDWVLKDGKVFEIKSDTFPSVEVPQMTADTVGRSDCFNLAFLGSIEENPTLVLDALKVFVDGYQDWVQEQEEQVSHLSSYHEAGTRIIKRMKTAIARMRSGLRIMLTDPNAIKAFAFSNQAMLLQMQQAARCSNKSDSPEIFNWRPFQLAFLLTTLESVVNDDSEFRDTVDLIWFPTGGGKTEAYLGVIALLIAYRRLRYPERGGGSAILMRYTLRLLARDQFLRATRLICAIELMRHKTARWLGNEPITIGLWVGGSSSPNTYKSAVEKVEDIVSGSSKNSLVVTHCPWCHTPLNTRQSFETGNDRFYFCCTNHSCDFAPLGGRLPCNVVDEALYAAAPTLLVATVDKFARLAWDERSNVFFGDERFRPPELIIQDELHLIAGPLGTIAGLYEASIDTVIKLRGVYPKYIASTATIRMAAEQVKRLYGREVAVFPPPGLSTDDSFFAKVVPLAERPGRVYLGYLAPLLNRQSCMVPLAAALLLAPNILFDDYDDKEELLDAWWTQVVYHGSLQGVGNSHTALVSDVGRFMHVIYNTFKGLDENTAKNERVPRKLTGENIAQLTSLQDADENAVVFSQLAKARGEQGCLDAALATNMISVGLDVGRLALMVINGQPLTTAEYIQASSRVGRSDVPGVVFANYYRDQARSLSYFESFRPYHESFYRYVEPTTVTPFSTRATKRALHAALVIVVRHGGLHLLKNETAINFNLEDEKLQRAVKELKLRCKLADEERASQVSEQIDALCEAWVDEIERCTSSLSGGLVYSSYIDDRSLNRLLYPYDDSNKGLWETLNSMRNVEDNALLKVL